MKKCAKCSKPFKQYTTLDKYCSFYCKKADKAIKVIRKQSVRREDENKVYLQLREIFLKKPENKYCPVMQQLKNKKVETTDVHHKKGKIGKLLIDTKYWIALSREGHKYVEEHPNWAKENRYSLNRLDK